MSLKGLISKLSLSGKRGSEGVGSSADNQVSGSIDKKEGGFTIVEVMIVLAIAGLVLAIVFIAVPALQRNSRNTQRRSDLANLRAQVDTWVSNNNGKIPSDATHLASIVGSTGWGHYNGNGSEPTNNWPTAAVATSADEEITVFDKTFSGTAANITGSALPNRQAIHIWLERKCDADGILAAGNDEDTGGTTKYVAADTEASTARAIAFVYQIEGEDNARCEDNI